MPEEVLTHGGEDRCYKMCECHRCKVVSMCTPTNDFYTFAGDDEGFLYCDTCFTVITISRGQKRIVNAVK